MEFLKRLLASVLMLSSTTFIFAQSQDEDYKYERSSLCLMMVQHPDLAFDSEIQFVFKQIPMPERFNDHSLGEKVVKFAEQQDQQKNIESFIRQVDLGKRCVARWFNRDKNKGTFDVSLLRERGFYDASALDINIAKKSARGMAVIEDAGEKLVGQPLRLAGGIVDPQAVAAPGLQRAGRGIGHVPHFLRGGADPGGRVAADIPGVVERFAHRGH